jgi:RNA polymerase sigma-70 factor (ECF subfamily)
VATVRLALAHDGGSLGAIGPRPCPGLRRLLRGAASPWRSTIAWSMPGPEEGRWRLPLRSSRSRGALSDQESFERLYFRTAQRALVFLTRRTADPEIAADLWGETWARAYAARDRYRGASAAEEEGWLFGIARHVLAGYYKRGHAEQRAMQRLGLERPLLEDDDLQRLERLAGLVELREALDQALRDITPDQQEALRLRIVRGLAYDEVARTMGVSEETARARVSRGLRALTRALERRDLDLELPEMP